MSEVIEKAIQDYYADDFSWCYGCGRLNEEGHHFRTGWANGQTVTRFQPDEQKMAIPGFVYGGMVASLIDCHGTGSASIALHQQNGYGIGEGPEPPRFVTASLQIDFVKPTPQKVMLEAIGEVSEIHPKKWQVATTVYAGDTMCAKGTVVAALLPKTFQT